MKKTEENPLIFSTDDFCSTTGISLFDFGGITAFNQIIELCIAAGFLFGTYFLAKSSSSGYIWLLVGNVSAAVLMMRQEYFILMTQQLLSIVPVTDALISHRKKFMSQQNNIQKSK